MVTPSELRETLTAADEVLLRAAEGDIDAALREDFGNKAEIWIAIQRPWTPHLCHELIRRYAAAGWRVRYESHQRVALALVFSAEGR